MNKEHREHTRPFASPRTTLDNGFTLIEVVIVLAIVGILAGVLIPTIKGYVGSAKQLRAEQDTKALGEAMLAFSKDTARFPIYQVGTATSPSNDVFATIYTDEGDAPVLGSGITGWNGAGDTFDNQLENNTPGTNGAAYPTTGEFAWRGPYIGPIRMDPWGNKYVSNANKLLPNADYAAWVLSAGPNETIETSFSQDRGSPTIGGDDIAYRIK